MAVRGKALVKVKQAINRTDEKKVVNSTIKKPVRVSNEQSLKQQQKQQQPPLPPLEQIIPKTAEFNRLIHGDFTQDFAKQRSRLFRIFLSSTFSDFKIERNELYQRVFPIIKQRCSQLGYEFQVVDMRLNYF